MWFVMGFIIICVCLLWEFCDMVGFYNKIMVL